MDRLSHAQVQFREMDELAKGTSLVHRLHPLCKLAITISYILIVVSFDKYALSALAIMVFYPVVMFQMADIPMRACFYKLRFVLPLVCAVGLANPFMDHTPMVWIGTFLVTGGVISMLTLMVKGCLALLASFLLVATTPIEGLCAALRSIHVPAVLTTLLLLIYRYMGVMMEEASIMMQAYSLRAPGQKGVHISAWGSFLGQLLLRSMDRAQELYNSMVLRGFKGEFYYSDGLACSPGSVLATGVCIVCFLFARFMNIAQLIGYLVMG